MRSVSDLKLTVASLVAVGAVLGWIRAAVDNAHAELQRRNRRVLAVWEIVATPTASNTAAIPDQATLAEWFGRAEQIEAMKRVCDFCTQIHSAAVRPGATPPACTHHSQRCSPS